MLKLLLFKSRWLFKSRCSLACRYSISYRLFDFLPIIQFITNYSNLDDYSNLDALLPVGIQFFTDYFYIAVWLIGNIGREQGKFQWVDYSISYRLFNFLPIIRFLTDYSISYRLFNFLPIFFIAVWLIGNIGSEQGKFQWADYSISYRLFYFLPIIQFLTD